MRENRDGWLVAWGLCECMRIRPPQCGFSPFVTIVTYICMYPCVTRRKQQRPGIAKKDKNNGKIKTCTHVVIYGYTAVSNADIGTSDNQDRTLRRPCVSRYQTLNSYGPGRLSHLGRDASAVGQSWPSGLLLGH